MTIKLQQIRCYTTSASEWFKHRMNDKQLRGCSLYCFLQLLYHWLLQLLLLARCAAHNVIYGTLTLQRATR